MKVDIFNYDLYNLRSKNKLLKFVQIRKYIDIF
jgi:hypothetical protein